MLKLVFAKYVRGLGWHMRLGPHASVQQPHDEAGPERATGQQLAPAQLLEATQVFLHSLLDVVEAQCEVRWATREVPVAAGRTPRMVVSINQMSWQAPVHAN